MLYQGLGLAVDIANTWPGDPTPYGLVFWYAMLAHGMTVAGGGPKVFAEPALEVLYRASRGIPRTASHLLRLALVHAHDRDRNFVDEDTVLAACDELGLITPQQDQRQDRPASQVKSRS